jgi:hypothetical protein
MTVIVHPLLFLLPFLLLFLQTVDVYVCVSVLSMNNQLSTQPHLLKVDTHALRHVTQTKLVWACHLLLQPRGHT